ncbi:MAG: MFS transporter [Chloroflexota bacterium]
MTGAVVVSQSARDGGAYRRRVRAWVLYDWANSAFATTILAAVLPVYYSQVAGATLPSEAVATAYWSVTLSVALLISAFLSPILGTISDVMRGKKRFLAIFTGLGILGTGLLVLVQRGDWLLASALFIVGRIGFVSANTFYDALLPHVARPEDRDAVSARGYAMGYLGGGILLAINVVMLQLWPGTLGARLSFLSVAIWWAVFSIPILTQVPEPETATAPLARGQTLVGISIRRLIRTLRDIQRYRELFKYLLAFLIYSDAIGTIIGLAAIYGAELGFGAVELILALLLVQFVGIPYSLIFGRLPGDSPRRPFFLAFIVYNIVMLPLVGIGAKLLLPAAVTGTPSPAYAAVEPNETGFYPVGHPALIAGGEWQQDAIPAALVDQPEDVPVLVSTAADDRFEFAFTGQETEIVYSAGPDGGIWRAEIDGQPVLEDGEPLLVDSYSETPRYGLRRELHADAPGAHTLTIINTGAANQASTGTRVVVESVTLPPVRKSSLPAILGLIVLVEVVGVAFAWLTGPRLFSRFAVLFDTRRSILLSLLVYSVVAVWGFFIDSSIEFWFLAWMVAMVQGGSQALSRSLYASMSPASKSGEFFGLYGIMEKFSAVLGPLVFAVVVALTGSSRPAVASLIVFFLIGGFLLTRVNVAEGQRIAREEDEAFYASNRA